MKKIVVIGGGEIGSRGCPVETIAIDKEIIRLTGKKRPRLIFIPTASSDSARYYETVQRHFGKRLGCRTDVLWLIKEKPFRKEIEQKIMNSDIVYVGGGNTRKMLRLWRSCGLDTIFNKALDKGIVLSGLSAGSICWFRAGISDSGRFNNPDAAFMKVRGLGFIPAAHSPHYDVEKDRRPGLKKIMRKTSGVAIAVDNCCAVEFVDDTYRVVASKSSAKAYKVYWKGGKYHEEEIVKGSRFSPVSDLLQINKKFVARCE